MWFKVQARDLVTGKIFGLRICAPSAELAARSADELGFAISDAKAIADPVRSEHYSAAGAIGFIERARPSAQDLVREASRDHEPVARHFILQRLVGDLADSPEMAEAAAWQWWVEWPSIRAAFGANIPWSFPVAEFLFERLISENHLGRAVNVGASIDAASGHDAFRKRVINVVESEFELAADDLEV